MTLVLLTLVAGVLVPFLGVARAPLVAGIFLAWALFGDNFGSQLSFDLWGALLSLPVNTYVGYCVGALIGWMASERGGD